MSGRTFPELGESIPVPTAWAESYSHLYRTHWVSIAPAQGRLGGQGAALCASVNHMLGILLGSDAAFRPRAKHKVVESRSALVNTSCAERAHISDTKGLLEWNYKHALAAAARFYYN